MKSHWVSVNRKLPSTACPGYKVNGCKIFPVRTFLAVFDNAQISHNVFPLIRLISLDQHHRPISGMYRMEQILSYLVMWSLILGQKAWMKSRIRRAESSAVQYHFILLCVASKICNVGLGAESVSPPFTRHFPFPSPLYATQEVSSRHHTNHTLPHMVNSMEKAAHFYLWPGGSTGPLSTCFMNFIPLSCRRWRIGDTG